MSALVGFTGLAATCACTSPSTELCSSKEMQVGAVASGASALVSMTAWAPHLPAHHFLRSCGRPRKKAWGCRFWRIWWAAQAEPLT